MTKVNEEYRCKLCGNVVKVISAGTGTLVCCGSPMELAPKQEPIRIPPKPTEPVQRQEPEQPTPGQ